MLFASLNHKSQLTPTHPIRQNVANDGVGPFLEVGNDRFSVARWAGTGRYGESNVAFRHLPEASFEDPSGCTTHQRPFNAVSISSVEANSVTKGRFEDAGRACLAM
jgi:hypothetical protein